MIIESRFKLNHCCASDDLERPVLAHINVTQFEGVDVAIAADGCMMAIVPVTMEHGDIPGMFHSDLLSHARRDWPFPDLSIGLEADTVLFKDGWRAPRLRLKLPAKYPDPEKVIAHAREVKPVPHVAFNPRLLRAVQKAIGADWDGVIVSHGEDYEGPLLVSPLNAVGPFVPPFGLLMPIHATAEWIAPTSARGCGA